MKALIFVVVALAIGFAISELGMLYGLKNVKIPNIYAPNSSPKLAPDVMVKVGRQDRDAVLDGVIVVKKSSAKPVDKMLFSAENGQTVNSADFKGRVTLLYLWGAHTRDSLAEIPEVAAAWNKYSPRGFAVYGIALKTTKAEFERFSEKTPLPFPNALLGDVPPLPVIFIPTTVLIDRDGLVRVYLYGPMETGVRSRIIEKLLEEK